MGSMSLVAQVPDRAGCKQILSSQRLPYQRKSGASTAAFLELLAGSLEFHA